MGRVGEQLVGGWHPGRLAHLLHLWDAKPATYRR